MKKILKAIGLVNIYLGLILLVAPVAFSVLNFSNKAIEAQQIPESDTSIGIDTSALETRQITDSLETTFSGNSDSSSNVEFTIDSEIKNVGNKIEIPAIGVDTYIWETTNGTGALDYGVWRLNTQGVPGDKDAPVVLAAHRWGAIDIDRGYRDQNMFFNLPSTQAGDEIFITWGGHKYTYEITEQYESSYVSKISDLVLITCKNLDASTKIIVLAQLKSINFSS